MAASNFPFLREQYSVDSDDELLSKIDIIRHNRAAYARVLDNLDAHPKANVAFLEEAENEHFIFLAAHGEIAA